MIELGFWLMLTFAGVEAGRDGMFYPDGLFSVYAPRHHRVRSTRTVSQFYRTREECQEARGFIREYDGLYARAAVSRCEPGGRLAAMTPEEFEDAIDEICGTLEP